jgi:hypothetical protein
MDYDGTNVQTLVSSNGVMGSMSIDFDGENMYWIERENGLIRKAKLDGTDIVDLIYQAGSQIGGQDISQSYRIADAASPIPTKTDFVVYPNPCKNKFYTNICRDSQIGIFNNLGQLVGKTTAKEGESIDISGFKNGIYFVVMFGEESTEISKMIIQND